MSASHHRRSDTHAKAKPAGPLRKLISAFMPKQPPAAPTPEPVAPKPAPAPKTPPPVQVLQLPKGVGTELRRAVSARKLPPPVKQTEPVKPATTTRFPSRRTRHRDFPVV